MAHVREHHVEGCGQQQQQQQQMTLKYSCADELLPALITLRSLTDCMGSDPSRPSRLSPQDGR
jgi:hypothetical protein